MINHKIGKSAGKNRRFVGAIHESPLREYDYSQAGAYFITICTQNRKCLFGDIVDDQMVLNDAGKMIHTVWDELPKYYPGIGVDVFQVMPNHIHGIIVIVGAIHESPLREPSPALPLNAPMTKKQRRNMGLPKIIGRFKMNTAKRINQMHSTPGVKIWQRGFCEHIIRRRKRIQPHPGIYCQ